MDWAGHRCERCDERAGHLPADLRSGGIGRADSLGGQDTRADSTLGSRADRMLLADGMLGWTAQARANIYKGFGQKPI